MADQNVSKLRITSATLKAIFSALQRSLSSPFKGANGSNTYFKDVMFAMLRTQLGNLDLAADRYMNGTTTPIYLKYAQDNQFAPESITLPSGTQAYLFGSRSAKKTLIYLHGGGYVMPCGPGHMLWLDDLQKSLGPDVSALLLAYDLAPEHKYPTQLRQAVELLRYLVETEGRSPSDIILGGDSAGANLILGLLSHLAHPHPDIPPLSLPSKLHAALLISPWAALTNTNTPAFVTNAQRDMFDSRTLNRWSTAFLGSDSPFAGDFYNEPILAAPEWWEPVADVVEEVLIWAGDNEVLKDGIEAFASKFTKGFGGKGGRVHTIVTPKACHEEMIVERILGYKGDSGTGSQQVVHEWVRAKL
ncbi:alpha/beta hydrolase fold domain-containing protein [Cucurbitaria berberidis CBS 394.84]|uniref:Alpha/beta hydrolase fold domain-containing protein n=1 Tax=Cucurbitaria berberidis CBS 394.84 TaxID=1168544 RepID=A0A9P4LA22_9PLEO|nr:alpha/beta hydrolase fold domain-containing protein [Cucurbitaria berberidis CBS 394.84]KAF1846953.1 alpha/beta hydrolase fold domain-containing protein [Cucurbitaria berberidis CBS 394.84]